VVVNACSVVVVGIGRIPSSSKRGQGSRPESQALATTKLRDKVNEKLKW